MLFVKGILSSVAQLARLGRRSEPAQPAPDKSPLTPTPPSSAGTPPSDAMRQILAEYDVANISPRAFSEMLQKLRQAGALSEKDFQELSSIRLDLDNEGVEPDQRVNLVERYTKKLSNIREQAGGRGLSQFSRSENGTVPLPDAQATQTALQRQLEWLRKSARVHAGASPLGFDTLA